MAEKKICDACGDKATGFNKYPTEFGNITLCNNCYEKVTRLKKATKFLSFEDLSHNQEAVNQQLQELKYPQKVIDEINGWYDQKGEDLSCRLQQAEINKVQEERLNEINSGKYNSQINNYLLTTGFNFEGYMITEYKGIVTGEVVLGTGFLSAFTSDFADMFGVESQRYANKLQEARDGAKMRAIIKSIQLGGNALIGVDMDYINFASDKIGVIFNGTSVVIEKVSQ